VPDAERCRKASREVLAGVRSQRRKISRALYLARDTRRSRYRCIGQPECSFRDTVEFMSPNSEVCVFIDTDSNSEALSHFPEFRVSGVCRIHLKITYFWWLLAPSVSYYQYVLLGLMRDSGGSNR